MAALIRLRGLVRKAEALQTTTTALLLSGRNAGACRGIRRRTIAMSAMRWDISTPSVAPAMPPSVAGAAAQQAAGIPLATNITAAVDDSENVKIDLSTVGAETTKILTIADVLTTREEEFAQGPPKMFEEWESIPATQTVHDAIALMVKRKVGSLIVTEEKAGIVGIVTERDIIRKTSPRTILQAQTSVKEIMSPHIMCIHPSTTVIDALATMTKENIRHLAVINGDVTNTIKKGSVPEETMRCVVSLKDIIKAYSRFEAQKKKVLEELQQLQHHVAQPEDAAKAKTDSKNPVSASPPSDGKGDQVTSSETEAPSTSSTTSTTNPPVTAATLLKKKHKKIKLILNTRIEDNVTVADAVEEMAKHNFGAVLVVDKEQRVLGIFTERDYLTKVLVHKDDPTKLRMVDVATTKLSFLQIEDSLEKCWNHAATQNFRHFPVIGVMRKDREKELAGILSIKDIVREISKDHNTTPGFRLLDFFKSKMEPKKDDTSPPASTPAAAATTTTKAGSSTSAAGASAKTDVKASETPAKTAKEEPAPSKSSSATAASSPTTE